MRPRETRLTAFDEDPDEPPSPSDPSAPRLPSAPGSPRAPPAPPEPEPRTVAEVLALVNGALERDRELRDVWVKAEVSNFKPAPSGHWYFDLKGERAILRAVMFRLDAMRVPFEVRDGMEVLVRGTVNVYSDRGQLQLKALEMRSASAKGDLHLRFEQLKTKLAAEGVFSYKRKRPLPQHPRRIGVVTSLAGAALRDIIRVATERHSGVSLLVANTRVQGEGAAMEIAAAIARFAKTDCDVLIVGRGGGSMEDLWAFNEEPLVRAVARSPIPIVSAVGHETDTTLCDLAADVRAATPSQAAELVVPDGDALLASLDAADARMENALERLVPDLRQRVDDLLERAVTATRSTTAQRHELLAVSGAHLDALSPLATLARGYAVARTGPGGRVLRSVDDAPEGTDVEIVLRDGRLETSVKRAHKEDPR